MEMSYNQINGEVSPGVFIDSNNPSVFGVAFGILAP